MKPITHNNLGRKYLVEDCQNIRVENVVSKVKGQVLNNLMKGMVEIGGCKIELAAKKLHHGGVRLWFICPLCHCAMGVIYQHPASNIVGCRVCLALDYRCRRFKGMIENSM